MLFSLRFGTVLILLALVACATKDPGFYRHEPSIPTLEVPPDLTQPVLNDSFAIPGIGAILNRKSVVSDGSEVQLMRDGRLRWLVIKSDPSYVWEKVKDYWRHAGVPVAWQNRELGIMETEWVKNYQNRFDRDQFRVRIEPAKEKNTSYLFLTHKGQNQKVMEDEVLPVWDERPTDYELETEVLGMLLAYLGLEPEQAKALVKGADENLVSLDFDSTPYALVVKDSRERVNRSVKLALDRSGYEIENEDSARSQLTVKLKAETTENQFVPGFALSKASQTRFFIQIKGKDNSVRVEVVSPDGGADTSDAAKNLLRDLKDRI